jgi:RNA polymerase sigma-70 factor, ECF subfamily
MSDLELIEKILLGDQVAMRVLIDRHKTYAYTIAVRIIGIPEEAEEAAQDAFIKAFKSLSKFKQTSKFTTWFYRIVFNTAVSIKRKKRLITEEINNLNEFNHGISENGHTLYKEEKNRYLNLALQRLKKEDNTIITLFYLQELSLEEMSVIIDIPANTLKVKLHRARKRLATVLRDLLKEEVNLIL